MIASLEGLVRQHLNVVDFGLDLRPEWASAQTNHRIKIRQELRLIFSDASVLDLDQVPTVASAEISISHHRESGGFARSSKGRKVGFDLELNARIRPELLARVSNEDELRQMPRAEALWVAKEAAFKCLPVGIQPRGLADLQIGGWERIDDHTFLCRIVRIGNEGVANNRGLVVIAERQSFGFFCLHENLETLQRSGELCAGF